MSAVALTLLIGIAGGLGAALRHLVDSSLPARIHARFPWGIVVVNLSGSFLLGLVTGLALNQEWTAVIATGLLGGYTTFSTASLDTLRLVTEKRYSTAFAHGPGMLLASVALAAAGVLIAAR
ncbi:hypothetical protein GCM10022261_12870 [Brevibacterium daeguense]|uniref:Fluoride-specific ion channel FluC n=1 Tax=Brevibacterium daeguense TaxID=909936 RepID=A0ABP8EIP9_9MICO|nr:CrcB family protein [Brevibacterium daeguense]